MIKIVTGSPLKLDLRFDLPSGLWMPGIKPVRQLPNGSTLQHSQGFNHIHLPEQAGSERQIVDVKGCLSALRRIRKDIMQQKIAAGHDMSDPKVVIGKNRL